MQDRSNIGVEIPVLDSYEEFMFETAKEIGLSRNGKSVSLTEIESYIRLSGIKFTLPEIHLLQDISAAFVNGSHYYQDDKRKDAEPPFKTELTLQARQDAYNEQRKQERAEHNANITAKREAEEAKALKNNGAK